VGLVYTFEIIFFEKLRLICRGRIKRIEKLLRLNGILYTLS